MSIEKRMGSFSRSFRTLIISVASEGKQRLRSLRTLGLFLSIRCYRHLGPYGPEELGGYLPGPVSGSGDPELQLRDAWRGFVLRTGVRGPVLRNARPPCCRCVNRFFARPLFRSFRTLMSIEKRVEPVFKVREDHNNKRRA